MEEHFETKEIGNGDETLIVTSGIHGNEYESNLLVSEFLKIQPDDGKITFINKINRKAYDKRKRFIDQDLNRVFPGDPNGNYEERIASHLLKKVEKADYVLDLHSFRMHSEVTVVCFETNNLAFSKSLLTKYIWLVKLDNDFERRYQGTMAVELTKRGIPNASLEMPSLDSIKPYHVNTAIQGYRNLLKKIGFLQGEPQESDPLLLRRKLGVSPASGILIPKKSIMEEVQKGEVIAEILTEDYEREPVKAFKDGILTQIIGREKVPEGFAIYGISELID